MSKAVEDVIAERRRQIVEEGCTPTHDDRQGDCSMAQAASCYAMQHVRRSWLLDTPAGAAQYRAEEVPDDWPDSWNEHWWKPKNPRRDLVRAAALLIAEIERLDRLASSKPISLTRSRSKLILKGL